jgi:transposase
LSSKRGQLVEARKRLLAQIKARQKQGVDELFQDMDAARRLVFDTQAVELENQIE